MYGSANPPVNDARFEHGGDFERRVCELYSADGLSLRRIAAVLGVPRPKVTSALRASGIAVSARGAGRTRPQCQAPKPAQLREILVELYVFRRLTRTQVAEKLEVPESRVRTWLREFDLPVRTRGRMSREDRERLAKDPLVALYVQAQMPADRVGTLLGSTRRIVLASAHENGVPVRPGGTGDNSRAIALLGALYADPQVLAVLRRRKVPLVRWTGPVTERFPRPIVLTTALLKDLYVGCGLSAAQIELVTGQPPATIRHRLLAAAVPARPAGGLAPFTRRARRAAVRPYRGAATRSSSASRAS